MVCFLNRDASQLLTPCSISLPYVLQHRIKNYVLSANNLVKPSTCVSIPRIHIRNKRHQSTGPRGTLGMIDFIEETLDLILEREVIFYQYLLA